MEAFSAACQGAPESNRTLSSYHMVCKLNSRGDEKKREIQELPLCMAKSCDETDVEPKTVKALKK